jgi:hypothetical protein
VSLKDHSDSDILARDNAITKDMLDADENDDSVAYVRQRRKRALKHYPLDGTNPWKRPSIRNVVCVYGVNIKTPVGYDLSVDNKGDIFGPIELVE